MRDVVSHRLKRSMRGAMAATVVAAAVGMPSADLANAAPAPAAPAPPQNASEALQRFQQVSQQAEQINEQKKKADDDHAAKQDQLARAQADAVQAEKAADEAKGREEQFRGAVDQMTSASFTGARMNNLSALVASHSPHDFLDRASALNLMAKQNAEAVHQLAQATGDAEAAKARAEQDRNIAAQAEKDAARLQNDINKKKADLDAQLKVVNDQKRHLTGEDRQKISGSDSFDPITDSGQNADAAKAALSKLGAQYVWGAKGPSSFDCSGLMQWAYKSVGKNIGGSTSAQVDTGKPVSQNDLKPGDLIFYYASQSHVAMYIGGGKAVHAPTEGEPVKVSDYKVIGNVTAIRRP
jgi:cell wall-associated NlpC family hydrolase